MMFRGVNNNKDVLPFCVSYDEIMTKFYYTLKNNKSINFFMCLCSKAKTKVGVGQNNICLGVC